MQIANKTRGTLCTVLLLGILAADAMSQTTAKTTPIPTRIIYWQMFKHVNFLEQQADIVTQSGKDGSQLRNFYQNHAQLTATETALLKQTASSTAAAIQAIDQQIHAIALKYRAQNAGITPSTKKKLPPPPPELKTLQTQRDNAVLSQVVALQAGLGPTRSQQFDAYVQTCFGPHILVATPKLRGSTAAGRVAPVPPVR